ncbi:hypothetical protein N658DRAFT_556360 [Parathielavia hyrcaniae]|uniref:Uncharacterized protein n=1 Tax=Parathielavia hyrcaniae TaxID=113614 RepID=A0AAN6T505_9PEZI|nr:hypothetical protein N658DRAFT_556360 [Parathielavia hyrcaniae]
MTRSKGVLTVKKVVNRYSHHTFVFYPLNNPEIEARRPLLSDANHESSRYLRARPNGFIFVRWLQHNPRDKHVAVVGLFASVDCPQELVVVKKLRCMARLHLSDDADWQGNGIAAEIEQCSLSSANDPMVRRQLSLHYPGAGPTPFPHLHAANIFLHYPTDEEKAADPALAHFTDYLPQIIVGNFGLSLQAHNDRQDLLGTADPWHRALPEPATLLDKADLGLTLLGLMQAHVAQADGRTAAPDEYDNELRQCWDEFWPVAVMVQDDWWERLPKTRAQEWAQFPSNDYVYGRMLSTADLNVERYTDGGFAESVRWTQPTTQAQACMPWRSPARRHDRLHREDRARVGRDMSWYRRDWFDDLFKPGCVEIRQAHLIGAGTLEEDPDLKQVDFGRVQGKAQPPKGRLAPGAKCDAADWDYEDELPDYEDVEDDDDDGGDGAAVQAKRATVRARALARASGLGDEL